MNTLVDFRRKLLSFDRPLYPPYIRSSLPRHYSSFFKSYPQINCWHQPPEWYPFEYSPNKVVDLSTAIGTTNVYRWMIIVLIIMMCLYLLKL